MSNSAEVLHRNYYTRKRFLNVDKIREDVEDVEEMIDILRPFLG